MIGFRVRQLAVPFVLAALLAGCAQPGARPGSGLPVPSTSPSVPVSPPATAATCPADGVRFEMGVVDAAMGLRALGITLINCGSRTYRLDGYPAVRSLDKDHAVLHVRVLHGVKEIVGSTMPWDGPPKPVVLEPGQRASAGLAWRNTYDDIRQPPVDVAFLYIAPLAGRPSQLVTPDGGLDLGSTGRIAVSAWIPARDTAATTAPSAVDPTPETAAPSSSTPLP